MRITPDFSYAKTQVEMEIEEAIMELPDTKTLRLMAGRLRGGFQDRPIHHRILAA